MSIKFGPNISSLRAQTELAKSTAALSKTFERLSSGLRINRASDDPAGLILAAGLNSDSRIFTQAVHNVNDGISMLSIAESGLQALTSIVARVQELAVQSANGSLSSSQRSALDTEAQALISEYSRITSTTKFNGISLLSSASTIGIQIGKDGTSSSNITISLSAAPAFGTSSTSSAGDGTFRAETAIASSINTRNILAGDFNSDGKQDLILQGGSTTLSVRLGNGDGTFKETGSVTSAGGMSYYTEMKTGDFNGDGNLDFVAPSAYNDNVQVFLGNGNGTFKIGVYTVPTGSSVTTEIEVGDFTGDGINDLLTSDYNTSIHILVGNSDGTFKAAASRTLPIYQFDTGDVNGDGKLDIIGSQGNVGKVYLGNGDGTFKVGSNFGLTNSARSANLRDYNNDGKLDVAFTSSSGTSVQVVLGNGDGTFKVNRLYTTGLFSSNDYQVNSSDVNGDGYYDLITAQSTNSVGVMINNGDGTFKVRTDYTTAAAADFTTIADFNGDGYKDIVAGRVGATASFGLLLGNGNTVTTSAAIDLSTQSGAQSAISALDTMLDNLAAAIGQVGAYQSRLDVITSMLESNVANYQTAAARITDVDVALEVAQMLKLQILQQAATAVIAQANQQSNIVLSLLKN